MKQAFKEFSPFQVNPDKVWADYNISASDFEPATESEKESMVEIRKSVSYWRDAARRFKNNTVSGFGSHFVNCISKTATGRVFHCCNSSNF